MPIIGAAPLQPGKEGPDGRVRIDTPENRTAALKELGKFSTDMRTATHWVGRATGLDTRRARQLLKHMERDGLVHHNGRGLWALTEKGKTCLTP